MSGSAAPGSSPRGLLAIFAPPDDESYGAGGLIAQAAANGNPAWVLCVTNGDQGGKPGEMGVDHSMDPNIRLDELRCACEEMGIAEPIFMGYRDSGMEGWGAPEGSLARADREEVIERMVDVIRRLRPATIVTFDPSGVYGHPDHVATSACATEAYRRTAAAPGGPVALYHQAMSRSRVMAMQKAMEAERSGDAVEISEDDRRQQEAFVRMARSDDEITLVLDIRPVMERKVAALTCHDSQMRGRRFDDEDARRGWEELFGHETFVRVAPPAEPGEKESAPMGLNWGGK